MKVIAVLLLCVIPLFEAQPFVTSVCQTCNRFNECCLRPPGGEEKCAKLAKKGETCTPSSQTLTTTCNCEKGSYCNPTPDGYKCGDEKAPSNRTCDDCFETECCLRPRGAPERCQYLAKKGEECTKSSSALVDSCYCENGLYCVPNTGAYGTSCVDQKPKSCGAQFKCNSDECCTIPKGSTVDDAICVKRPESGQKCTTLPSKLKSPYDGRMRAFYKYGLCPCKDDKECVIGSYTCRA